MSKIFLDTNILVYSLQKYDLKRNRKARAMLKTLQSGNTGVVSTQVLQEFYVVATRKLNVDPLLAKQILQNFENFELVTIDSRLIYQGIDCSITNGLSFWDALIIVAARSAKCSCVWTEDLNDGQVIQDVRIQNPFLV